MAKIFQLDDNVNDHEENIPNEQELDKIAGVVFEWVDEFYESAYYDKLDGNQQYYAEEVIAYFASFSYSAFNVKPDEWDEETFATTIVDVMPITLDKEIFFFQTVLPVMVQFMAFLNETAKIDNATSLKKHAVMLDKEMNKLLSNPVMWYSYLFVRKKAIEHDVDITDDKELEEFSNREDVFNDAEMKDFIMEKMKRDEEFEFEDDDDDIDEDDFDEEDDDDDDKLKR